MKRITLERLTRELKAKLFSKGSENKSFFFLFFLGLNLHLNIPGSAQTIGLNH
jgi:hypothetical protein